MQFWRSPESGSLRTHRGNTRGVQARARCALWNAMPRAGIACGCHSQPSVTDRGSLSSAPQNPSLCSSLGGHYPWTRAGTEAGTGLFLARAAVQHSAQARAGSQCWFFLRLGTGGGSDRNLYEEGWSGKASGKVTSW